MLYNLHSSVLDVDWGVDGTVSSEVEHQFLGFIHIQNQVVIAAPFHKKPHLLHIVFVVVSVRPTTVVSST